MQAKDEKYWAEYDGLQHAKHQILRSYLGGWFPILSSWSGEVFYIDCHAGRGRHKTGHEGSPILALRLLRDHKARATILSNTRVYFHLFEIDERNFEELTGQITALGELPANMIVRPYQTDYQQHLQRELANLRSQGQSLAATFAFVDPYGFSISVDFLNEILSFPATELLVNFMYRYVDMAKTHADQFESMEDLFGPGKWQHLEKIQLPREREVATVNLFSSRFQARYITNMYMRAENSALKYALIHATNHRRGRELIKEAMWNVAPDGTFTASERDSPEQPVLLVPEANLDPLKADLWEAFAGMNVEMVQLYDWLVDQLYLPKHLHKILGEYRESGVIQATGYSGRFGFGKNPVIEFPSESPA